MYLCCFKYPIVYIIYLPDSICTFLFVNFLGIVNILKLLRNYVSKKIKKEGIMFLHIDFASKNGHFWILCVVKNILHMSDD